jgi:Ca2+/Na+ antiporter
MDINYWVVGAFVVAIVVLIAWLIKRNRKDEKAFEEEIIQSDLKPGEDEDHDERSPDNV